MYRRYDLGLCRRPPPREPGKETGYLQCTEQDVYVLVVDETSEIGDGSGIESMTPRPVMELHLAVFDFRQEIEAVTVGHQMTIHAPLGKTQDQ